MTLTAKVLGQTGNFKDLKEKLNCKLADVKELFKLNKEDYEKMKSKTPLLTGSSIINVGEKAVYLEFKNGEQIGLYEPIFQGMNFKFLPRLNGAKLTKAVKDHESFQYLKVLFGLEHDSSESLLEKISKVENPEKVIITQIPKRIYGTKGIIFVQYLEENLVINNSDKPDTIFGYPLITEDLK